MEESGPSPFQGEANGPRSPLRLLGVRGSGRLGTGVVGPAPGKQSGEATLGKLGSSLSTPGPSCSLRVSADSLWVSLFILILILSAQNGTDPTA